MADISDRDTTGETAGTTDARTADDRRGERGAGDLRGSKLLAGFASLIGLWIAVAPFVYGNTTGVALDAAGGNNVIVGAAIFLVAGYNYYRMSKGLNVSGAAAALVALLGLWLVVAPLAAFDVSTGLLSSTAVSGLVVAAIGAYNLYKGRQMRERRATARTT